MLFATDKLETGRYVSIGTAFLPPILIFSLGAVWPPGRDSAKNVEGRPKSFVFALMWTVITLLWTFALVVASFRFRSTDLILLQVFALSTLICCLLWLWQYHSQKKAAAAQIILLSWFFSTLTLTSAVTSEAESNASKVVSLSFVPLFCWLLAATLFNYLEVNNED